MFKNGKHKTKIITTQFRLFRFFFFIFTYVAEHMMPNSNI